MIPLVNLKIQYKTIKKEIDTAIANVLKNADFILGEDVNKFEKEFAEYCGVKYAIGIDSGISALELGMRALGLSNPDIEVLTPANSFIASSSAISFAGAKPVLVDCNPDTYNIDLADAKKKLTKKTKAIMVVHLYGQVTDMREVVKFAKDHNLFLIEDACQAHGARYKGKMSGSFGSFGAFSFYPGKNLGAYGDGGIVVTNSKKVADTILMMRNYGQKKKYNHKFLSWNKRLDTIQAAVLRVKLRHLDDWSKQRIQLAKLYTEILKDTQVVLPQYNDDLSHVFHLYVIRTKRRNKLLNYLHKKGIGVGIHYPIPIHLQDAYKYLGYKKGDFPITEQYANEIISLPLFPEMSEKQVKFVAGEIVSFFANK